MVGLCATVSVSAVAQLSVGQLRWRQPGRDGLAGDGQQRVKEARCHGGQSAEHDTELIWRSLLWGKHLSAGVIKLMK